MTWLKKRRYKSYTLGDQKVMTVVVVTKEVLLLVGIGRGGWEET